MEPAVERTRNKGYYRVLHVPIWIYVFFSLPGVLAARMYQHGPTKANWIWLAIVTAVCAWRGALGRLPGAEERPYITHYGLEWPNLPYRIVCYTGAWIAILASWTINLIGFLYAASTGRWIIAQLYGVPYDIMAAMVIAASLLNWLPRTRSSIYGEGAERAWFYIGVWTAVTTEAAAWAMWRLGPAMGFTGERLNHARLNVFLVSSAIMLTLGLAGKLPRTRRFYVRESGAELQAAEGE